MANLTPEQFAVNVLQRLKIKPNKQNVTAMVGWENAEGGHFHNDAKYNPLNTTQNMPGSGDTGSQGNISVYKNWRQGEKATVKTLKNGNYGPILQSLRNGSAGDVANAIGQTPWGTGGGLVQRTIASTKIGQVPQPSRLGVQSSNPTSTQPQQVTTTVPGVDNRQARATMLLQYLQQSRQPGALSTLISGIQGAQDTPAQTTTSSVPGQVQQPQQQLGGVSGSGAALGWAESKLGKKETGGENRGQLPDKLNARFGFGATGAQPWCAMFTSAAIRHGGAPKDALSASVAEVRQKAQQKVGYRGFVKPQKAKAGDLILFGNDHIGMVDSVSKNGIQMIAGNDSDQVQKRTVPFSAGDIVRPDYSRKFKK